MTIIAHVDMDCFFCSVEEKHDPSLKGKPVIVGGRGGRGVVSASNYIAREFGVYSAMSGRRARGLCPMGNFLPVNMKLYKKESDFVMKILRSFSDEFVQASVDEAYLDLTSFSEKFSSLEEMGKFIQDSVYKETKLSCSIGIAECKLTAKIASDFKKPSGVTVVLNQKDFLEDLDIKKIPGIGKKSVSSYYSHGIKTIGDLGRCDVFTIIDIGGKNAVKYRQIARGERRVLLKKSESRKSISLETTFSNNQLNKGRLLEVVDSMCDKIFLKIGDNFFRTVSIKLRDSSFKTITRDYSFNTSVNSLKKFKEAARNVFNKAYVEDSLIRLVGVKISNFSKAAKKQSTLDLF